MTVERLEHVGVVVDDLEAAKDFFLALGLRVQGENAVEGEWVDRIVGLEGVRSRIVMLETADGHGHLELTAFDAPASPPGDPAAPANVPGLRHVLFVVDDIEAAVERVRPHGAELIGEITTYRTSFRLCYLRGPAGIIVELAEELG